ncbi:hypothetical protein J6590_056438 [Homalodisca vitripennis]|nr:hypothetical protein J6590_056438 [Homalodisca vitripennis]
MRVIKTEDDDYSSDDDTPLNKYLDSSKEQESTACVKYIDFNNDIDDEYLAQSGETCGHNSTEDTEEPLQNTITEKSNEFQKEFVDKDNVVTMTTQQTQRTLRRRKVNQSEPERIPRFI